MIGKIIENCLINIDFVRLKVYNRQVDLDE